jgi:hypothetical protein
MKKKDYNALGINLTQQKFAKSLQRVSDLNNLSCNIGPSNLLQGRLTQIWRFHST